MISVILVGYQEAHSIGRAIDAFLHQSYPDDYEILLCASDTATYTIMKFYEKKNPKIAAFLDKRLGKPHSVNLLLKKAKGDIIIFSDGDVTISNNAVTHLIQPFSDPSIGAVTGRPVSINQRNTKLGYWSHLLTVVGAHRTRVRESKKGKYIPCSGYLYAIRNVIHSMPNEVLSDDAYMSQAIWQKGYKIRYAPNALVYVRFPTSYKDWILQKRRSGGGVYQLRHYFKHIVEMRTFWSEALYGLLTAFSYPKTIQEFWWTIELFFARLHLWWEIRIHVKKNLSLLSLWKPVQSTK